MTDDYEERFQQHEEILRSLTAMLVRMDGYLARQDAIHERLQEFNGHQVEINFDTKTTLARIETLLARMLRHEDNGRDAGSDDTQEEYRLHRRGVTTGFSRVVTPLF